MANINPFLSKPDEWKEELRQIKEHRKKLDKREAHLLDKLAAHEREQKTGEILEHFKQQEGR